MQESGLTGISLLTGTTTLWGQCPSFLHCESCHFLGHSQKHPYVKFRIPQRKGSPLGQRQFWTSGMALASMPKCPVASQPHRLRTVYDTSTTGNSAHDHFPQLHPTVMLQPQPGGDRARTRYPDSMSSTAPRPGCPSRCLTPSPWELPQACVGALGPST